MALFDFPGCGNSKGEYITYGITEKYDVDSVLRKLEAEAEYKEFYLWGRSMGAAVVIQYADLFLGEKQNDDDHSKKRKKKRKEKSRKQKDRERKKSEKIPEKIQKELENGEDSNRVIQKSWKDKVKYLIIDSSFTNLFEMLQGT